VTNGGPNDATSTVLTDTLGAGLQFVSATTSQGSYTQSGGVVTISLGTVASGQTVTATVTAQAIEDGNLTNTVSVTSSLNDPTPGDNTVTDTTTVTEPAVVVSGPIHITGKKFNHVQVATFTHANGVEPASAFTATINWGDGTTSQGTVTQSGSSYIVKGSHNYASYGTHTVTTTVTESDQPVHGGPHGNGGVPGIGGADSDPNDDTGGEFALAVAQPDSGQAGSPRPAKSWVPSNPGEFATSLNDPLTSGTAFNQPASSLILGTTAVADADSGNPISGLDFSQDFVVLRLRLATSGRRSVAIPQGPRALGLS
jgi:hypothetical protein